MSAIQTLPGFQDILPEDRLYWDYVTQKAIDLAQRFGFKRLDPPVLEDYNLFQRGNGEASDFFVNKEMYVIEEVNEKNENAEYVALRPEFTAGMVRAYIEHGLHNLPQPVKLFTIGPAFRRERHQANRFRQHTQFDVEVLGEIDPAADLEVMMLAMSLYQELGYADLSFSLNSTGCPECKPTYVKALVDYLSGQLDKLAPIDQERLRLNPLRILDTKEEGMDELLAEAPHIVNYLCEDCASHFDDLTSMLNELDQPYNIDFRLVRGIDYYQKTVFEVKDARIGAQATLCGGGRYDGLAEAIGGKPTPGVGFGMGIERTVSGLKTEGIVPPALPEPAVFISHFGGPTKLAAISLTYQLRAGGIGTRIAFARGKRSMKSQMREANKFPIKYTIIIGEDELEQGQLAIRNMESSEQELVAIAEISSWLKDRL